MSTAALLFERDKVEEVEGWASRVARISRTSILWVDIDRFDDGDVPKLVDALELSQASVQRLRSSEGRPFFGDFGSYLHVTSYAPSPRSDGESATLVRVECLVSERWVVTLHDAAVPVLEGFRERAEGTGDTGRLDGLEFLANLLDWMLTGYLDAFENVEVGLDEFDARAMEGRLDEMDAELRYLVELRREIGRLRRALVSHREMFLALTRPELEAITSSDHAARFEILQGRLESAVQAARDSRESVVGSFDVLIAQTEQRTNEIMKVLTLASVLLLPGALIAGVMGMNFKVGLFENAAYFWVVVAGIIGVALATTVAARMRGWI